MNDFSIKKVLNKYFSNNDYSLESFGINRDNFIEDAKEQFINNIYDKASEVIDDAYDNEIYK